jgi:uncharacterized protein YggE
LEAESSNHCPQSCPIEDQKATRQTRTDQDQVLARDYLGHWHVRVARRDSGAARARASAAQAYTGSPLTHELPRTITVVSKRTIEIRPDTAQANIGITIKDPAVKAASDQAREVMAAVLRALKEQGIAAEDVQTTGFSIWAEEQPFGPERSSSQGEVVYCVSNQVMATIRDLNKVGAILDAAIEAGANSIHGVSFRIDDPDGPESEAWEQAGAAALAKAEELAAPHNAEVGDLINVSEVVGGRRGYFASGFTSVPVRGLGDGGGTLSSGELELSLRLQVVYGIQQMKQR